MAMMFDNPTAGGIPPQLLQMLQQRGGMGGAPMGSPMGAAGLPMGQGAMPQVPMPGPSQGAGGAIPQGAGMFGGLGGQQPQQPGGMFGAMDPMQTLALANLFKPTPQAGPSGPGASGMGIIPGMGAAMGGGAMSSGGGMGDIGSLLRMLGIG